MAVRRGSNHPNTTLTETDVRAIRALYTKHGLMHREIAEIFGISRESVGSIIRRIRWAHVI